MDRDTDNDTRKDRETDTDWSIGHWDMERDTGWDTDNDSDWDTDTVSAV
jgi:hypothetical protein